MIDITRKAVERLAQEFHDCDELPDTLLAMSSRIEELEAKLHKAIWELEILGFDFESTLGRELMEVDDEYEDDEDE